MTARDERRHRPDSGTPQHRSPAQRDRDRIVHSSALQRLANVTQVAGGEGLVFHNRLTHTIKVAQIARRLAEKLERDDPERAQALGGLNPDVVEAAALAHDLGHPPFGHIAEEELDSLARANSSPEGFEGNAQTFRILTRLATHRPDYLGLDVTRATLNATLKYPWVRDTLNVDGHKFKKFGAYTSERDDFIFARQGFEGSSDQSLEAAVMDYADSIAYSVHDLDDFFRAGLIPIEGLLNSPDEWDWFIDRWRTVGPAVSEDILRDSRALFIDLLARLSGGSHYSGTRFERALLRSATAQLIDQFVRGVRLGSTSEREPLIVDPVLVPQLTFLQALVWAYVIRNPRLTTQQYGQREIIRFLFSAYLRAVRRREIDFIPAMFQEDLKALGPASGDDRAPPTEFETRVAVDIVAQFTDAQAVLLYRRLSGSAPGSVIEMLHA